IAGYERRDGVVVLTHTVVERAVEGQGVGSALACTALDTARAAVLHVVPVCPFMDAWIRRQAQYADLDVAPPDEEPSAVPAGPKARFEPHARQVRRGQRRTVVAADRAEAGHAGGVTGDGPLPLGAGGDDLLVRAPDEAPPHEHLLLE